MDFRNPNSGNNKPLTPQTGNFLETLRGQASAAPLPHEYPSLPSFEAFQEKRRLEQTRREQFFQTRVREFNEVYSKKKDDETKKIETIRLKLEQLAKSVEKFNKDITLAASQKVDDPGNYHLSFFDQLISLVELLQKKIEDSNTWLQLFQSRSKKQGFYWNQTKSQGAKFMGANERNIATAVG